MSKGATPFYHFADQYERTRKAGNILDVSDLKPDGTGAKSKKAPKPTKNGVVRGQKRQPAAAAGKLILYSRTNQGWVNAINLLEQQYASLGIAFPFADLLNAFRTEFPQDIPKPVKGVKGPKKSRATGTGKARKPIGAFPTVQTMLVSPSQLGMSPRSMAMAQPAPFAAGVPTIVVPQSVQLVTRPASPPKIGGAVAVRTTPSPKALASLPPAGTVQGMNSVPRALSPGKLAAVPSLVPGQ